MQRTANFEKQKTLFGFCCWNDGGKLPAEADFDFGEGAPWERPVARWDGAKGGERTAKMGFDVQKSLSVLKFATRFMDDPQRTLWNGTGR